MSACLDIVIVNYNTGPLLAECVASLAAAQVAAPVIARLTVVDNASGDGSLAGLETLWPGIDLIRNAENRGFAAACNQGAAAGQSPYVLFLNPDARVFAETLPAALSVFAQPEYARIGIVGVPLIDELGRVAISCSRLPRLAGFVAKALGLEARAARWGWSQPMREWAHDVTREVEQVMGAFFLMPRAVFRELGGFDEHFFVYFEEVDLSARARAAGWRSLFYAGTRAYHKGCGSSERLKAHRLFYSLRSRLLYGAKHFSPVAVLALLPLTLLLEPLTRAVQLLLRRDGAGLVALAQGLRQLWADSPNWWRTFRQLRRERRA